MLAGESIFLCWILEWSFGEKAYESCAMNEHAANHSQPENKRVLPGMSTAIPLSEELL